MENNYQKFEFSAKTFQFLCSAKGQRSTPIGETRKFFGFRVRGFGFGVSGSGLECLLTGHNPWAKFYVFLLSKKKICRMSAKAAFLYFWGFVSS